jgi:hypothetical protein
LHLRLLKPQRKPHRSAGHLGYTQLEFRALAISNSKSALPRNPQKAQTGLRRMWSNSPRFGTHFPVLGVSSGRSGRRPIHPSIIPHDCVSLHLDLVSRPYSNVIIISPQIQTGGKSVASTARRHLAILS